MATSLSACSAEEKGTEGTELPSTFADCGASTCEVALGAFDDHCVASLDDAIACNGSQLESADCDGLQGVRNTYGFPGDYYLCIYDKSTKDLVGAVWSPDNHPKQIAGEQLSESCSFVPVDCPDGGGGGNLPDTFGDCGGLSTCEVDLSAFTKSPGTIPYCEGLLATALDNIQCANSVNLGSCDGLYAIRNTYGFPGDYFTCVYNEATGELVGAIWSPDSHPRQIAGTLPPDSCELTEDPCTDAGAADAATD